MRRLVEAASPEFIFHLAAVGVTEPFIAVELALRVNVHGTRYIFVHPRSAHGVLLELYEA